MKSRVPVTLIDDYLRDPNSRYAPYKSRPEHQIAGLLDKYGLPFIYEKPTAVMDGGKTRLWYPDFTLAYGPLIEYFGIVGKPDYDQRTKHKLAVYRQNQIQVLPLYPRDLSGAWQDGLLGRIDHALERRLEHYRARTIEAGYQRPLRAAGASYGRTR